MLSKTEIKYIQSLGHKKRRAEERLFLAEGTKLVSELVKAHPTQIFRLYGTAAFFEQCPEANAIADHRVISTEDLERITQLQTAHEVVAIVKYFPTPDLQKLENEWYLALDGIRDPGNMGTIIRLADWFGINTIICSPDCADWYNPKVVQATMGSLFRVQLVEKELHSFLPEQSLPLIGAVLGGEELSTYQFPQAGVLVIGNEANGISAEMLALLNQRLMIPRFGAAESLNAAIATSIFLWELRR